MTIIGQDPEHQVPILDLVALRTVFLALAKEHFGAASNYGRYEDDLAGMVYNPDSDLATMDVALSNVYDPLKAEVRPCVYVRSGAVKFIKQVLGNYSGTMDNYAGGFQTLQAVAEIRLLCVHESYDIALKMAETVMVCMVGLRENIMSALGLLDMEIEGVGEPDKEEPRPINYFRADVPMKITFNFAVQTAQESHVLKKIELGLSFAAGVV